MRQGDASATSTGLLAVGGAGSEFGAPLNAALRSMLDSVKDYAIFLLTPEGHVATWNAGAQKIKGYAAHEIVGKHFSVFYPPTALEIDWPAQELVFAAEKGTFEDEGWRVRRDGSLFWANVVISTVRDEAGALVGFVKVTRDLTERRRQEQALRESEHGMRLLVEGTRGHAMFLLGTDGRVRSWNTGAQRLLGYSNSQAQGLAYDSFFLAKDVADGRPAAALAQARSRGFAEAEGWCQRADGSSIWSECSLSALTDDRGTPSGYAVLVRDLTERRRVELLEEEGQRMTQFIATLSHELRNPLAPIRHALQALNRRKAEPNVQWAAEVIGRQVTHLTRLVDDLLDFSRAASGRMQLQLASLDLRDLLKDTAQACTPFVRLHKHHLALDICQDRILVLGDPTRLAQVLTNVLNNAAKYTPAGGRIDVSLKSSAGLAILRIADTGTGMTEAMLRLAFEPFVQADRTLERSEGGMGIGLALVKRIVELHGGTVRLASPGIGKGTTVTIELPLDGSATPDTTNILGVPSQSREPVAQPVRRILVVDDNVDAAESLAAILTDEGHEVAVAFDGPQALAHMQRALPEIVLLDVGLPGMSGLEVAAKVRASSDFDQVRLIAVTGYGQPSDLAATRAAGFDAHLTKPFEFDRLLELISR